MTARPLRRLLPAWIILGLVLWAAAVFLTMDAVRSHLEAARAVVAEARTRDDPTVRTITADMARLDEELRAADALADSPLLTTAKWLPVLGRQIAVVDRVAETGAALSAPTRRVAELAEAGPAGPTGPERLEFLDALIIEVRRVDEVVRTADLGPSDHLFSQVAAARNEAEAALRDNREDVAGALDALVALRRLLDGGTYLLLGANNAEMRTGGGMVLSLGSLQSMNGEPRLNRITPADERFPVPESPVVDPDIETLWGYLSPTNDYRKLTYTARFDEYTGPQALAMWEAETGEVLDGTVLIDAFFIQAVLAASGPVDIDGRVIDADGVVDYLLKGQYARYGDADERRDQLADLAAAVFVRLQQEEVDFGALISRVPTLVRGRHLMIYSVDPEAQAAWESLGVAGHVASTQAGVFLNSLGGSKLDPYMEVSVDVADDVSGDTRTVRLEIAISNTVEDAEALADYVVGPWESAGLPQAGAYSARVVVYAPGVAGDLRFAPDRTLEALGHDGPVALIATRLVVEPGRTERLTVRFEMPVGVEAFTVVPSARHPAVRWVREGDEQFDTAPVSVVFS